MVDPHKQLKASLTRLIEEHPAQDLTTGGGLYNGLISVAYLFLKLQQMYPDLEIEGHDLAMWSTAYLKRAQDDISKLPGPTVGRCGIADDILALLALGAASSKDVSMVNDFLDYSIVAIDPGTDNEFLYGRAGYLYLLRLIKASFPDDKETLQSIVDTQDDVVDTILDANRPWKWMGKNYVGAIHGSIGIITQIVLCDPAKYAPIVEPDLAVLLTYQYESGNWPSSLPPERDRLVQICHGAPGVIVSLLSIKKYFPSLEDKINKAIAKGRECIEERGLLTKEPCICHGECLCWPGLSDLTPCRHHWQCSRPRACRIRELLDLHDWPRDEVNGARWHAREVFCARVFVHGRGWSSMGMGGG